MKPIHIDEILSPEEYERRRPELRRRIMALKARRRVPLGEHATLHFETRETMWYQVHEMLRAEGSWARGGAAAAELEAYNPLIPRGGELSATLMFEYETPAERAVKLAELVGIEGCLRLLIGDAPPVVAVFDRAQVSPSRISSVQYVRFPLNRQHAELVGREGTVLKVVLDHPAYRAQAVLGEETRKELAADLA
ncbi:MAG: DUF3501 family protein [Thermoanaerobaculaceae bacterium]|nr:DUF3501 family protein [Thermoanaerobaculaceae bacterium]